MSKESTAFGAAIFKLVEGGATVEVTATPGHGQNKSSARVTGPDDTVLAKFQATDLATLAQEMTAATRNTGDITATTAALSALDYAAKIGGKFRYAALDEKGDLVIDPEFDTPIQQRQRAAAIKRGIAHGAAAVYDIQTGEIERISLAPIKKDKG